jgi:UDP-N-acetylglucosamine 1-carboxyvinyltransferase
MDKFIVHGGRALKGEVSVAGAKNSVLPIMAAALLPAAGTSVIRNVPDLADVHTMARVLSLLGARVNFDTQKGVLEINASGVDRTEAPYDLVRKMRASFIVMGPLLARFHEARVSLPGGCSLGQRPVNLHLRGFERMGTTFTEDHGYIHGRTEGLVGATVHFDRPSHTGTENIMLGAVLASGTTHIINAACDPEVEDVAAFLSAMGARVKGAGTTQVTIEGSTALKPADVTVMPDRLEAGTYLMAGAITGGNVKVKGCLPHHLELVLQKLVEMGCEFETGGDFVRVKGPKRLRAADMVTFPYPGYPTDLQAAHMSLCCVADGTSHVRETVFEDRFTHVMELLRLGASIKVAGDEATIRGVPELSGASVMASDIRAGAGLVVAALAARNTTEVLRIYHIDRGYVQMEQKFAGLGADITRLDIETGKPVEKPRFPVGA